MIKIVGGMKINAGFLMILIGLLVLGVMSLRQIKNKKK
jgi:hypothetical protein